ncbi:unnamed protein product [Musa acuminata var. zebrina]
MLPSGARPNKFTFTFLLRAASAAAAAPALLHARLTVLGLHADPFLRSALIAAYSSSGRRSPAALFVRLAGPHPDVVLRTALVSALARCGLPDAARDAFDTIPVSFAASSPPTPPLAATPTPSPPSAARAAPACHPPRPPSSPHSPPPPTSAPLPTASSPTAMPSSSSATALGTALLTMSSRCARLESARRVFDEIPHNDPHS